MDIRRISVTVLSGILIEFFNKIAPLLIIFVIQRRLGMESFGFAMFGISMVELFLPLIVFGYSHYGSVYLSKIQHSTETAGKLISDIIFLRLIHAFLISLLFVGCTWVFPGYYKYQLLSLALIFSFYAASCEVMWVFMAIQKMSYFNLCIGIGRIISLVSILLLVQNPGHGLRFAVLTLLSNAIINGLTCMMVLRKFPLRRPSFIRMKSVFKRSAPFAIILALTGFFDRIDMLLVEQSGGPEAAGLYAAPARLTHSLMQISNAIILTFFSEMVILRQSTAIRKHLSLGSLLLVYWCGPLIVGGLFVGKDILEFLFGPDYQSASHILVILLITLLPSSLILAFGMQILVLHKKIRYLSLSLTAGIIPALIPALSPGDNWSSEEIALMLLSGKCTALMLIAHKVLRITGFFPWRALAQGLIPALSMGSLLWIWHPQSFILIILEGALLCLTVMIIIHRKQLRKIGAIWKH